MQKWSVEVRPVFRVGGRNRFVYGPRCNPAWQQVSQAQKLPLHCHTLVEQEQWRSAGGHGGRVAINGAYPTKLI